MVTVAGNGKRPRLEDGLDTRLPHDRNRPKSVTNQRRNHMTELQKARAKRDELNRMIASLEKAEQIPLSVKIHKDNAKNGYRVYLDKCPSLGVLSQHYIPGFFENKQGAEKLKAKLELIVAIVWESAIEYNGQFE